MAESSQVLAETAVEVTSLVEEKTGAINDEAEAVERKVLDAITAKETKIEITEEKEVVVEV